MDKQILAHYRKIGKIRKEQTVFRDGLFRILALTPDVFAYIREPMDQLHEAAGKRILVLANRTETREYSLPKGAKSLETGRFCGGKQTLDAWTARYYTVPADAEITAESLGIE